MKRTLTRRTFLAGAGAAVGSLALGRAGAKAPRMSPLEKLNIAGIGVGGRGMSNMNEMAGENIVALCDVDDHRAGGAYNRWPDARRFSDFREMFDEMANDIDAVVISTPDHVHAVAALAAIQLDKHVYVEKPLTHSVKEARALKEAAREHGVVTQMGNQGMAGEGMRRTCEILWSGAIGQVHTAHVWTDRPEGWWPQGVGRPEETPEVPDHLDWNLWLGPAPERPYSPAYAPRNWRGFWEFGTCALGDMGCHNFNPVNMALQLGAPTSVETVRQEGVTEESGPTSCVLRYEFPARQGMDPVTVYWYDGSELPEIPEGLPENTALRDPDNGTMFEGADGVLTTVGSDGNEPRLLPEQQMEDFEQPPELLPRSPGHHQEFIQACKGGPPPQSNFEYACPFTETVLLGNVALRAEERIEWDSEAMRVTNVEAANELLHREYREGWSLA